MEGGEENKEKYLKIVDKLIEPYAITAGHSASYQYVKEHYATTLLAILFISEKKLQGKSDIDNTEYSNFIRLESDAIARDLLNDKGEIASRGIYEIGSDNYQFDVYGESDEKVLNVVSEEISGMMRNLAGNLQNVLLRGDNEEEE